MDKFKQNKINKFIISSFSMIITCLFTIQLCDFISLFLFKKSFFIIHVILFVLISFIALIYKDFKDSKEKVFAIRIFKISIFLFLLSLVQGLFCKALTVSDFNIGKQIYNMSYLFNIGVIITLIALFNNENVKEAFKELEDKELLKTLLKEDEKPKEGDIVIGEDIETNKPVIWHNKDRFLHMLILGPTGSGKTSQIIIPSIYQDMKNLNAGITVIEPKADLAEKVYAMAKVEGRDCLYFNPILPSCPYFNPLYGDESDVIENLSTTFRMFSVGSSQYFLDMNDNLVRRAVKVIKRLYGNDATLLHLDKLIHNTGDEGRKMVVEFSRLNTPNPSISSENADIAKWFLDDYLAENKQGGCSKTFENTSGIRSQVAKLVSNKYLRKVLNPPAGIGTEVDFDKALEQGDVIAIATAQGALRDLGRFLGLFIILQLESAVFRRPGTEDTRKHNFLYIDEFQCYANPGFADMLTQGRSYRVASHLATQNRALIGMGSGQEGKDFIELVSTNARNVIVYPGGNASDAKYYSEQFGKMIKTTKNQSYAKKRFFSTLSDQRVTTSIKEEEKERFTASDIIYRPFGEVVYSLINKNSIGEPGIAKINYIPMELNKKLDKMILEYQESERQKQREIDEALNNGFEKPNDYQDLGDVIIKQPEIQRNDKGKSNNIEFVENESSIEDINIEIDVEDDIF